MTAWFGDTPFEHPFSHNTPSGSVVVPGPGPPADNTHSFPCMVSLSILVCMRYIPTYKGYKQQKNLKRNIFKWIERGGP